MGSLISLADYAYGTLGFCGVSRSGFLRGRLAQAAHAARYRMHRTDLYGPVHAAAAWQAGNLIRAIRPRVRFS